MVLGHPQGFPPPHSTHLARGADGLGEELDEGLVAVGGQHPVLHQLHHQPQGTQLPPAMTREGLSWILHPLLPVTHGGATPERSHAGELLTPGSCSRQAAACTHLWSSVVLGKGRSWNQPLVGSLKMVFRGNSTWETGGKV